MAAFKGHTDLVRFLLSSGADANILCLNNTSPLAMACWNLHPEIVFLLRPLTRSPYLLDCYGQTCFDAASRDEQTLSRLYIDQPTYTPTTKEARCAHLIQQINIFVEGLLANRLCNDMRLYHLGKNLLKLHDITEAEHCFQLDTRDMHAAGPLQYLINCNMCEGTITGNLYTCTQCAERDLCEGCMEKYKSKTAEVHACKDHTYHTITHRHWEGKYTWPLELTNTRGMSIDQWLWHLKAGYGASQRT